MKVFRKKIVKNNSGFSLVELLVAVTILAIIVVPLSRSFVTAARTNYKSKRTMEATTAGQNLLEILKIEDLEKLKENILTETAIPGITDPEGNSYYKYEKLYKASDLGTLSINGHPYEAKVTIDPSAYLNLAGLNADALKDSNKYNSIPMARLGNMNTATSAFYVMEKGEDLRAAISLNMDAFDSEEAGVKENYLENIRREIRIKVGHDVSTNETVVRCSLTYIDGTNPANKYTPYVDHEIYRNKALADGTRPQLSNLFICFVPLFYTTEKNSTQKETIYIENEERLKIKTYLVKQELDIAGKDFSSYKYSYDVNAEVKEGYLAEPAGKAGIEMLTNMNSVKAENRILLTYKNGEYSVADAKGMLNLKDGSLKDEESSMVIYDIEVEVYKDGESGSGEEPLVVLKGTTAK